jgi:hypothetical protein
MPASVSPHNGGGISPVSFARDNQSPSFGVSLGADSVLLPILALIAGILILIGK